MEKTLVRRLNYLQENRKSSAFYSEKGLFPPYSIGFKVDQQWILDEDLRKHLELGVRDLKVKLDLSDKFGIDNGVPQVLFKQSENSQHEGSD